MAESEDTQSNGLESRAGGGLIGRRKALQLIGLAGFGGALIKGPGGVVALAAADAPPAHSGASNSMPETDFKLLSRIMDIIIPKTDTAGAVEAGVPEFVASALVTMSGAQMAALSGSADVFMDNPPVLFADGLQWIRGQAQTRKGRDFMELAESD